MSPIATPVSCGWSKHLIFEVPSDDGEQGPLDLEVAYGLRAQITWGDYDPPRKVQVEAAEELTLWDD